MNYSHFALRFDPAWITDAVTNDLRERVDEFEDVPLGQKRTIYEVALGAISRGGSLHIIADALFNTGLPKARAAEVARYWGSRASAIINVERMVALGIKKAKWLHPSVPCYTTRTPSEAQVRMDGLRKRASGKLYPIPRGMLIDGRRTHPGMERGCGCVHIPVIPGFDD